MGKKVFVIFSYIEQLFILLILLVSAIIGCVLISAFASLDGIPIGIVNSAVGLKIGTITAEIKKY